MSIRFIVGMVMFFMINTVLSNIIEQQEVFTPAQISELQTMQGQQFTEAKEEGFGITTTGITPLTALNAIWKSLTLDYSFLYDVDYGITEEQCALITNADWQTATSSCKIPNAWFALYAIMIYAPILAVSFYLVLTIWHSIRGG